MQRHVGYESLQYLSWATGLFIALACIVSRVAGIMSFIEAKRIKKIEGVRAKSVGMEV